MLFLDVGNGVAPSIDVLEKELEWTSRLHEATDTIRSLRDKLQAADGSVQRAERARQLFQKEATLAEATLEQVSSRLVVQDAKISELHAVIRHQTQEIE